MASIELLRLWSMPMKASHLGPGTTLTWLEWQQTIADFNGMCAYCRIRPNEELEHFIPRSKGGKTEVKNCLPACRQCNIRKTNYTGAALIGAFGQETIERLQQYLASRLG